MVHSQKKKLFSFNCGILCVPLVYLQFTHPLPIYSFTDGLVNYFHSFTYPSSNTFISFIQPSPSQSTHSSQLLSTCRASTVTELGCNRCLQDCSKRISPVSLLPRVLFPVLKANGSQRCSYLCPLPGRMTSYPHITLHQLCQS